jgi:asparagine synthase (glutamine-hydrolysing)
MCGLVGIWRRDGRQADLSAITAMLSSIGHRGPDGKNVWLGGRVALGHVRLSIIDLTEGSGQPMISPDESGVLAYNGEVYNYGEIREELEREGVHFRSSGDTEVVLQALHVWGPARSIERFDGMFAFAYFDRREGALWLGRDRIGIKPLIIAETGAELLFASEAKAVIAHPRMNSQVDRHALAKWIVARGRGPQRMLFAGVRELEPGCLWKITAKGVEKRRYFHVLTAVDVDRLARGAAVDPEVFVSSFSDHLKRSVRLHLESDVPLAAMCSGGVDSSLIAAYAKEQVGDIKAYVADVSWPGGEGAQAARVGRHLQIPVHRVKVDQSCFLNLWPQTVWHSDGPPTHPSDPALLAVAETCRSHGIKVLLTGEGSDELFGGYDFLRATYKSWCQLRSWRLLFAPRASKQILASAPFARMAAPTDPRLRNRLTVALDSEPLPQRLLDLLKDIEPDADRAFLAHSFYSLYDHLSWILHRHDRMGMAASMEMRVPFLENDMFDFAFHLPRRAKLQDGIGKWVVKRAAERVLPENIVYARKKGFPVPVSFSRGTQRLLIGGKLAELMDWSGEATDEIVNLLRRDGFLRFQVVGLELWARIFFGGEAPAALAEKLIAFAGDRVRRQGNRSRVRARGARRRPHVSPSQSLVRAGIRFFRRSVRQLTTAVRRPLRRLRGWALNSVAIIQRKAFRHVTFVGVTGSCGKTTTTRLVGAVLGSAGRCRIRAGSNSHNALIRNVLSVNASTKFCVQEVSGSWPGRIAVHCRVLKPQIGIVTTIGTDHYKNFRSLEATTASKRQLVELLPRTGIAILNADDPYVLAMAAKTSAQVVTFGKSAVADLRATEVSSAWPDRLALTVCYENHALRIRTRLVGEHWTTSVLAAITSGVVCGVNLQQCAQAIENFDPPFGRYSVHEKPGGPAYIFDHKAPFWTIATALAFVRIARAPRTTIVFGTISDYPGASGGRYRRVAREALQVADRVVFVGPRSGHVTRIKQVDAQDRLFAFETTHQASMFLAERTLPAELIFIKGSMAADHLERIMLSQLNQVVCWREGCGRHVGCHRCRCYRKPSAPPFRIVKGEPAVAAPLKPEPLIRPTATTPANSTEITTLEAESPG